MQDLRRAEGCARLNIEIETLLAALDCYEGKVGRNHRTDYTRVAPVLVHLRAFSGGIFLDLLVIQKELSSSSAFEL